MGIKLSQRQEIESILAQQLQSVRCVTLPAIVFMNSYADLTTRVERNKIRDINRPQYPMIGLTHYHQAQLLVGKHITLGTLYILPEHVAGIRNGKITDIPHGRVILHLIHHIHIFRLYRTKIDAVIT